MDPIRLFIADDHAFYREGVRAMLERSPEFCVVGEAPDGEAAVQGALETLPDVVLMDVQMPHLDGLEATRRVVAQLPHVRVLIVTMFEDDATVFAAMRAGARGYLLKDANRAELERAIRAVASGEAIFSAGVAAQLLGYFSGPQPGAPAALGPLFPTLTERERGILDGLKDGLSNAEIAAKFGLSPKTVRNHLSNIYDKLQVRDRVQAVLRARGG